MGLLDKFKKNKVADKVGDVLEKSGEKIVAGVDKTTDFIDDKTKGKYHDKLEKVDGLAGKLDRKADDAADAVSDAVDDADESTDDGKAAGES